MRLPRFVWFTEKMWKTINEQKGSFSLELYLEYLIKNEQIKRCERKERNR
jgi:hypothetical protein